MYIDPEKIGLRIKRLRKQNGLTREQLAEKINVSTTHLYRLETGVSAGSMDLMVEIAAHFDVSLDYLVLGKEQSRDTLREKVRVLIQFLISWLQEL